MWAQLLLGTVLICVTVFTTVGAFALASLCLTRLKGWLRGKVLSLRILLSLFAVVLWLVIALSVAIWIWAAAFLLVGEFQTLEESVYFSMVSFTTLGFGDVIISKEWRLLAGMVAANGFLLFSLATAFLIEFITRIQNAADAKVDE